MNKETQSAKEYFRYLQLAGTIEEQILSQTLQPGDRLPSLRTICSQHGVSQSTALNAYLYLESKGLVASRPKSGYYVHYAYLRKSRLIPVSRPSTIASYGESELLVSKVYDHLGADGHLPLALGTPANELLPIEKLNKGLIQATRDMKGSGVAYDKVEGNENLRRQIARWSFAMGASLDPGDIITTSGCLNALSYCLMAVTEKGDTVAMESPVSFGMLQLAEALGLKVLELPTHPETGVDIDALGKAFQQSRVNACLLISNFSNPLGSCMPDDHKQAAVKLAEQYNIPLIENDINGDVYFGPQRPRSCKTFDESGIVLWCGSVSKTLAPGYRVGWTAPGHFKEKVLRMKLYHSISSTSITQEVIATFLETGRYEHHLRKLRSTLHANMHHFTQAIDAYFPEGTRISRPQGGFVLWTALHESINAMELYEQAIALGISFAPGRIFTLQDQYKNCLRLNYGLTWNDKLEATLKQLGKLVKQNSPAL